MSLSKDTLNLLLDLVENKISCMQVNDREDMREMMMLQRCLTELQGYSSMDAGVIAAFAGMPRRGRRRKMIAY